MYPIRSVYHGIGGAGAPLPTDIWNQQHYPFGSYGQEGLGGSVAYYAVAFFLGWIAHDYYSRQG
jgi:hypothetical protein